MAIRSLLLIGYIEEHHVLSLVISPNSCSFINKKHTERLKLKRYLNKDSIFGMGFVWDGTKCSTVNDAVKDSGRRIVNYQMGKLFVMSVIPFI